MHKSLNRLALQLGSNHFLKGSTVISYETPVAEVRGTKLKALGKFSRTTTKHIASAAHLLGLDIERNPTNQVFDWFANGAQIRRADSLTIGASRLVLQKLRSGLNLGRAIAASWLWFSKKDRARVLACLTDESDRTEFLEKAEQYQRLHELGLY